MIKEIADRRSIRKYRQNEVPVEVINEIIQAGRLAPSGKNKQPWKFLVYRGSAKREFLVKMEEGIQRELSGNSILPDSGYGLPDAGNTLRIMGEAPALIVVMNPYGKSPFEDITADERVTEIVDSLSIGAAIQNMLLEAERLGIGTLWIANTCFAYPELTESINEPGQLIGAVALGYAAEVPRQRPRKMLDDIVEYRYFREQ